jgi:hypothetical protein
MENVIEYAVRVSMKSSVNGGARRAGLLVRNLLRSLAKKLPEGEVHLAVGADPEILDEVAPHAVVLAMASPGDFGGGQVPALQDSIRKHSERHPGSRFLDGDFFQVIGRGAPFSKPVGLYYYAGATYQSNLRAAVVRAAAFLAPQAIAVFGNWSVPSARAGAWEGVAELGPRQLAFFDLPGESPDRPNGFGNGCGVFHFRRD